MSDVTADSVVNLCGAIGLGVAMLALHRRDPRGPLTKRLLFALGVAAALFLMRGVAWWTETEWLDRLSLIPAALVPLGALVVTEGILRRHAPRSVKMAAMLGAIVLGPVGALGPQHFATLYSVALSLFQLAGFATCAWLLVARDRTTLLASENRSIGRVALGAVLVTPFIVTDFVALVPDIPVRLGRVYTLTASLVGRGAGSSSHRSP